VFLIQTGPQPRRRSIRRGRDIIMRVAALVALLATPRLARACDLCAIYTTTEEREEQPGFRLGVAEQYTYFATLKDNSQTVPNPYGERLRSSITQILAGYNFHPRVGVQINFPIIYRTYRRVLQSGVVDGDVDGIGDMSVIANVKALSWFDTQRVAHLFLFGGLKFPTGDPAFLSEEIPTAPCIPFPDPNMCSPKVARTRTPVTVRPHHSTGPPSGIGGHDLTLGTGSVDGIVGAQAFGAWRRVFATVAIQYVARTVGAFDYQFANDLLFESGPGAYLLLGDDWLGAPYAFGAQVLFSGETKGTDSVQGQNVTDTGLTALYLGPAFRFTWGTHLAAEIAADLPVLQHDTGLQIVPDYRLRGGITWRF
jgi:hypothetical protein